MRTRDGRGGRERESPHSLGTEIGVPCIPRFALAAIATALACAGPPILVPLGYEADSRPESAVHDTIAVVREASDERDDPGLIGHVTVSLFAIPVVDVESNAPLREDVVWHVAHALRSVGYQIKIVDSPADAIGRWPVLKVAIAEFDFRDYNWLTPFYYRVWGDIGLTFTLLDSGGTQAYQQSFAGAGSSSCSDCGFSEATSAALTELLSDLAIASTSTEFREAFAR
jgi:hypothetical protein